MGGYISILILYIFLICVNQAKIAEYVLSVKQDPIIREKLVTKMTDSDEATPLPFSFHQAQSMMTCSAYMYLPLLCFLQLDKFCFCHACKDLVTLYSVQYS